MTLINPDKIADIIKSVAQDKIVPRFQSLSKDEISTRLALLIWSLLPI